MWTAEAKESIDKAEFSERDDITTGFLRMAADAYERAVKMDRYLKHYL